METALYFPHMQVPEEAWFTQILLYWDHAAFIVPSATERRQRADDPYLDGLCKEGLLSFIDPSETLFTEQKYHDAFLSNFLEGVVGNTRRGRLSSTSKFTRVHIGKMEWSLFNELRHKRLATVGSRPEDQEWWRVEPTTASMYLAYLASALSAWRRRQDEDDNTFPVTDSCLPLERLAQPLTASEELRALRYRVITRALPVPEAQVDPVELCRFKDDHRDQLERLRRYLDTALDDLVDIEDKQRRGDRVDRFRGEISDELESIRSDMQRRRWARVVMCGFAGVMATGLAVGAAAMSGAHALAEALCAGSGVATSAPTIALEALNAKQGSRDRERAPLAYAALAAERFGDSR
jgi:hypothetical protein